MRNTVIDYAAAETHGVTACGTASFSPPPVELTWALLLGLAHGVVQESNALRSGGPWQSTVGADPYGRRLGLLGLGKIGGRVAGAANPGGTSPGQSVRSQAIKPRSAHRGARADGQGIDPNGLGESGGHVGHSPLPLVLTHVLIFFPLRRIPSRRQPSSVRRSRS
jgi:hypothetical protein